MDTTIQDSLNIMAQHTQNNVSDGRVDWWMWIAIAEFVILLILVLSKKSLPKNERLQRFKNESMNHEIDFNNTISSAFHAEELYDELKVKCHPDRFPMKQLFSIYSKAVIPLLGKLLSKDNNAYRYLPDTIKVFPQGEIMKGVISRAGFSEVNFRRLTFGICTLYTATK